MGRQEVASEDPQHSGSATFSHPGSTERPHLGEVEDSARLSFTKDAGPYIGARQVNQSDSPRGEPDFMSEQNYYSLKANRGWAWTANFDRGKGEDRALLVKFLITSPDLQSTTNRTRVCEIGFYFSEREKQKRPSLVETGR